MLLEKTVFYKDEKKRLTKKEKNWFSCTVIITKKKNNDIAVIRFLYIINIDMYS